MTEVKIEAKKPKFEVNIEGKDYPWNEDVILVSQIRNLGNLPPGVPVIEVDLQNGDSKQLAEDEVVKVKPGQGFSKKIEFRRGGMSERLSEEISMLGARFPGVKYIPDGEWIYIPKLFTPPGKWAIDSLSVCFQLRPGYPDIGPYSLYVSPRARTKEDLVPNNYSDVADPLPPFSGEWGRFSGEVNEWKATADIVSGSNLLNFVESFRRRLEEGV